VHHVRRHEGVAFVGIVAEPGTHVQQHAKGGVVHRLDEAHHIGRHLLGAPVILGADAVATFRRAVGVLPVARHNGVELRRGPGGFPAAGVDAHSAGAQDLRGMEVRQGAAVVGLPLRRIIFPDVGAVDAQVGEHQSPLIERVADEVQILVLRGGEHPVPDVRQVQVIAVATGFQVAEQIHLPLAQETVKRI